MQKQETMISAIIVTYNPKIDIIKKQCKLIAKQVDVVIYIDNFSENIVEIKCFIDELNSNNISLVENSENMGIGFAQNQGIRESFKLNSDFVVLFDQDSIISPNFISSLLAAEFTLTQQGVKVGAVGPIYVNEETHEKYPITKYWGPFIKRLYPSTSPIEASVLISSGILIPLDVISQVGEMDDRLFIDYVDIEWSYRARNNHYKLFAVPTAIMHHQIGDKRVSIFGRRISVHSPLRRYYLARNSVHMLKCKYISAGYKLREVTFNILRILVITAISHERFKYLKFSFRGIIDGFKGVYGPCNVK